jgi:hypothetical protein
MPDSAKNPGRSQTGSGATGTRAKPHRSRDPRVDILKKWRISLFAWISGLLALMGLLKFGTPIILQDQIQAPGSPIEWLFFPWPIQVAYLGLCVWGISAVRALPFRERVRCKWLWLPLGWLAWQFLSALFSIDKHLTQIVLPHFFVNVGMFYAGFFLLSRQGKLKGWAELAGLGLMLTLWTGTEQRMGGLEATRQAIPDAPYFETGLTWNKVYPEAFLHRALSDRSWLEKMRTQSDLRTETAKSHGLAHLTISDPKGESPMERDLAFLEKIGKNRIFGTFGGYPNALAAAILLLLPLTLVTLWRSSRRLQLPSRILIMTCMLTWAMACLYWSGSKGGWLVGMAVLCLFFLLTRVSWKAKVGLITLMLVLGSIAFGWKYQDYFRKGATSVSARFEYWKAGWATSMDHPLLGSGPGTFMRSFGLRKPSDAEMTRLTHNDYLQQASDSGWPSAVAYAVWILGSLLRMRPRTWDQDAVYVAVWLGLIAMALQNTIEFGLYIPALSWPFFILLGWLWGQNLQSMPTPAGAPAPRNVRH